MPARPEHARDLGQRVVEIEPVEGLPRGDDVHRSVRKRECLGGAGEHLDLWEARRERRAHRGIRLDADDVVAGREQRARELAGAGPDVEDTERRGAEEPRDRRRRIPRAVTLVDVGAGAEGEPTSIPVHRGHSAREGASRAYTAHLPAASRTRVHWITT